LIQAVKIEHPINKPVENNRKHNNESEYVYEIINEEVEEFTGEEYEGLPCCQIVE